MNNNNQNNNQNKDQGMSLDDCREVIEGIMETAEGLARPGTDVKMMASYFIAAFARDFRCGLHSTPEMVRTAFYNNMLWGIPCDNTHARLEGRGGKNPSLSYIVDTAGYMAILASLPQVDEVFTVAIFGGDAFELPEMFAPVDKPPFKYKRGDFEQSRDDFFAAIACLRIRGERYWRFEILDANEFDRRDRAADRKTNAPTAYDQWTEQTSRTKALKKLFENLLVNWSLRGLITVQNLIQECEGLEETAWEKIEGLGGKVWQYTPGTGEPIMTGPKSEPEPEPETEPEVATFPTDIFQDFCNLGDVGHMAEASEAMMKDLLQQYAKAKTKEALEDMGKLVKSINKAGKLALVDLDIIRETHYERGVAIQKEIDDKKAKADKKKADKKGGK